jgi:hypothetical protein
MAREYKTIDIGDEPALMRLVEEIRTSREPVILRRGEEELAILQPTGEEPSSDEDVRNWRPTAEQIAAFRSIAGAWKDVDTDRLIEDIYEGRRIGADRPPVEL